MVKVLWIELSEGDYTIDDSDEGAVGKRKNGPDAQLHEEVDQKTKLHK